MCYIQSQYCPEPHNCCHFSSKIKGKVLLDTWIYCILGPIQGPKKGLMKRYNNKQQVFSLKYQLKQFVLMYRSQKSNFYDDFSSKIWIFEIFERKHEKKVFDLFISGWVEANPVNFSMFFFIFWPHKLNSSTRYTFFLENEKLCQNAKRWLKIAIKMAFFTSFWLFQG